MKTEKQSDLCKIFILGVLLGAMRATKTVYDDGDAGEDDNTIEGLNNFFNRALFDAYSEGFIQGRESAHPIGIEDGLKLEVEFAHRLDNLMGNGKSIAFLKSLYEPYDKVE